MDAGKWKGEGGKGGDEPIYLLSAYPVERDTEMSFPIGSSGTDPEMEGENRPGPMQVLTLLVKTNVFGWPACVRRRRDMVPMRIEVSSQTLN